MFLSESPTSLYHWSCGTIRLRKGNTAHCAQITWIKDIVGLNEKHVSIVKMLLLQYSFWDINCTNYCVSNALHVKLLHYCFGTRAGCSALVHLAPLRINAHEHENVSADLAPLCNKEHWSISIRILMFAKNSTGNAYTLLLRSIFTVLDRILLCSLPRCATLYIFVSIIIHPLPSKILFFQGLYI